MSFWYNFLLVILILDSLVLVTAILLQSGKGGGLAASFGGAGSSDSLLGSRQAGNLLTATSWWGGGIFIFLAFVLQILSTRGTAPKSVLDTAFPNKPAQQTAPATPNAKGAAPALPLEPVTKQPSPTPAPAAPAKKP